LVHRCSSTWRSVAAFKEGSQSSGQILECSFDQNARTESESESESDICYYNLLFSFGLDNYCAKVREAGADGLLVLDCPPEEADELIAASKKHGLANIFIVAPTTPPARIGLIAKHASGFIYYVSREGVTGERSELAANLSASVAEIRKHTSLPICVGFGVSTAAHVQAIAKVADGVVVGSALVNVVAAHKDNKSQAAAAIGAKVRELLAK